MRASKHPRYEEWCADQRRRSLDGRRLWRCWHCDSLSPWTNGHGCFCSVREIEEGDRPFPVWCSDGCRDALIAKHEIPPAMETSPS